MLAEDLPTSSEDNEYRLDCGTPSGLWGVSVNEVAPRTFNSASPPRERASNLAGLQSRRLYSGVQDEEASTEDTSTGGVLTGQYVSLAEDTSSRETAILSPDGKVAVHKNVLPELCAPSCAAAIVVYIGTLLLVGAPLWPSTSLDDGDSWLHDIKSYPEPDPAFARMCLLCAVAFMAAAVHNATALIFLRRGAAQRSVSHCAVCINVTAAHAHWMMGAGHSPTFNSCFGRTMHATRFAEWLSTLFLMMVLTNALDCSSRRDLIRSSCMQVASVALGFAASATCQLTGDFSSCLSGSSLYLSRSNDTHTNNFETCCGTAVHWQHRGVSGPEDKAWWLPSAMMHASKAHQLNLLLLLGSCWCFAGWPLEVLHEWRERFSAQRAGAEVGLAHATQAAVLRAFAAAAWTLFPALYFLGAFDPAWFPPNIEIYAYSAVDLLTKFMYANVLCDANLLNLWAEDRARAQIARKESANEAHRHFLRYVFHEVRVPLNTIRLGLNSVPSNELNSDTAYVFGCLDEAANSISDILNDVLSYQKVIEGKVEVNLVPFEVDEFLRSCHSEFAAAAAAKDLSLTYDKDFDVPPILYGDVILLRQVLSNFLSNAIKFTNSGGSVSLRARLVSLSVPRSSRGSMRRSSSRLMMPTSTSSSVSTSFLRSNASSMSDSFNSPSYFEVNMLATGEEREPSIKGREWRRRSGARSGTSAFDSPDATAVMEFSVTDTGCGISSENQDKLFEAFLQLRAGDLQSGRGSGLGMSLSKHLVELMNGSIEVQSHLGQGSTFSCTVCLPLAPLGSAQEPTKIDGASVVGTSSPKQTTFPQSPSQLAANTSEPMVHKCGDGRSDKIETSISSSSNATISSGVDADISASAGASDRVNTHINAASSSSHCTRSGCSDISEHCESTLEMCEAEEGIVQPVVGKKRDRLVLDETDDSSAQVLIADDVAMNRKMTKRCLEQLGLHCDEAVDGAEAVAMCAIKRYRLVLMDNLMPRMNGVEAAAAIRQHDLVHGRSDNPRILGLTGNAASEDVAQFQRAGCDDVLTKPLRLDYFKSLLISYGLHPTPQT